MAFWIEDRHPIVDFNRPGRSGEIIKFGCDTPADIAALPGPNPEITGSSAFVLTPAELWKLGAGGWVKVG